MHSARRVDLLPIIPDLHRAQEKSQVSRTSVNSDPWSRDDDAKKSTRRSRMQKSKSDSDTNLVYRLRTSVPMTNFRRDNLRKTKSVQFLCSENGEVKCQEHKLTKSLHRSLWWNEDEMRDIRSACIDIVRHAKAGSEIDLSDGVIRGLEAHILTTRKSVVDEHRRLVLGAQSKSSRCIRQALKVSLWAQNVAYETAEIDTREALKALLTKWEVDTPVMLD